MYISCTKAELSIKLLRSTTNVIKVILHECNVFYRNQPLKLPLNRHESELSEEQILFLNTYGFLHFRGVLSPEEVKIVTDSQERLEQRWLSEGVSEIRGVPIFFGPGLGGKEVSYRLPFCSEFDPKLKALLDDPRFEPIKSLVGDDVRIGHNEQDGVVINRYVNAEGSVRPGLGWHTDGLRDIFYLRKPQQMLNFGLHLDKVSKEEGGLRLLPGTHLQSMLAMMFRKPYL